MESVWEFFSFKDPNIRYVVFGCMLLSSCAALVGSFTFLKKKALIGDAIAHSVLPGVCLAFLFWGSKNPVVLIIGAFLSGWLSTIVLDYVVANSKLKKDTVIGLVLSVFFGIGVLLLTYIQQSGNANQSGLNQFLFGKAAALVGTDLWVFSTLAIVLLIATLLFYKEFTLIAFDPEFAHSIGLKVGRYEFILTSLTVLAVVVGIQAIGVVLMAAILITPSAAARYWTNDLRKMLLIAAVIGALSGLWGAFISYVWPSMPTGPWIVIIASLFAFVSFLVGSKKGYLLQLWTISRQKAKVRNENLLKVFYQLCEIESDITASFDTKAILQKRFFTDIDLNTGLKYLRKEGFLEYQPTSRGWSFTAIGEKEGKRIVRLHRLWELYLTNYTSLSPDMVHPDAERMEHIITPELEKKLEDLLGRPSHDPHQSVIPYN